MLFKNIVVSLVIFQVLCIVQARTPDDVINDFEERFEEIHSLFSDWEDVTSSTLIPLVTNVTLTILNQNESLTDILKYVKIIIQQKVLEILQSTGMIDHKDLVSHCIKQVNNTENTLIITAFGGQKICVKTAKSFLNDISDYVETLQNQLQGEHDILEVTREECGKRSDPFDVQTCLINDLYTYYTSYEKDAEKEVKRRLEVVENDILFVLNQFHKCDDFLNDGIEEETNEILDNFRMCVLEAKSTF